MDHFNAEGSQACIRVQLRSRLYLCTDAFVNFAVSGHTSIYQLPVPLLPLSFTPNLITVILSTMNSLSLNYPVAADPELSCSYCH